MIPRDDERCSDYEEFVFKPISGSWASDYEDTYVPLDFSEKECDRMIEGKPIYPLQSHDVVSCDMDCCGRIHIFVHPNRSAQNHNPELWEKVEKYFFARGDRG